MLDFGICFAPDSRYLDREKNRRGRDSISPVFRKSLKTMYLGAKDFMNEVCAIPVVHC